MYSQRTAIERTIRINQSLRSGRPLPRIKSDTNTGRQAGRQVGEDRYQNQTTVTRTRRLLPEPDDCCQNQTTVTRTRRPLPEPDDHYQNQTTAVQTTSQRTLRTIQSIDRSN